MKDFTQSPFKRDLISVPGIGPKSAKRLESAKEDAVHTPEELHTIFLSLADPGIGRQEHGDRFRLWLARKGITTSFCNTITRAFIERLDFHTPLFYGIVIIR